MTGSYFLPRLLLAFIVPLTLASFGPTQSHPELGTDVGSLKSNKTQVFRANDIRTQVAVKDAQKERDVVKLQAFRRGQKMHFKRKEE